MEKKIFKYARISTSEQNEARQVEALKDYPGEMLIDKISGKIPFAERPEGKKIIQSVNEKSIFELIVLDVDRLGRNTLDIMATLQLMKEHKICVTVHRYGLKSFVDGKANPTFELISNIMSTLAQIEIERTKERQKEGIVQAKQRGAYKGRPKGSKNKDSSSLVEKYPNVAACLEANMSIDKTVAATGVSRSTVKRIRKEYYRSLI
ncbi:recombinase family protein [Marinifilum flexuosum]|uniref:DNA invertase Pin-like site-specific DNA recombinase n=1 Tax=Marinifilum flexuosum TaxID=1117708 RepID=A0A419X9J5_9BACT|nr:recombinase family protein [Marinifilum flexuosum]RKE04443.1 DNA invertase Pin-like site-specific DNA recombinase [Marinifilum flexuosum]